MTKIITRFAPSPTGFLHVGNVRVALINYLLTKKLGGKFLLRIDDTDLERSKPEYIEALQHDLKWLGLNWDGSFRQSDKIEIYNKYFNKLIQEELIYPCYETKEELEYKRKIQLSKGEPPIYDRSALKLTEAEKQKLQSSGRKPYYRYKISPGLITWQDLVKGEVKFQGEHISDPVIIKENGTFLYSFCSVIDDFESNISHIIRGEDHLSNTAIHIQLFKSIGCDKPPIFGHLPLMSMLDGSELSKRLGVNSIKDFREAGILPMALVNYIYTLGQTENAELYTSLEQIVQHFDIKQYGSSVVKFDIHKLYKINALLLKKMSFAEVQQQLLAMGIQGVCEDVWELYHDNIETLADLKRYQNVLHGDFVVKENLNRSILQSAINHIPKNLNGDSVDNWLSSIIDELQIKKKDVMVCLREAITGDKSGPNFKHLFEILPHEIIIKRLQEACQKAI